MEGKAVNPGAQGLVTRGRPALVIGWALAKDVGLVPWCPRSRDLDGLSRHGAQGECVRVQGLELLAGLFEAVAGQLAEALNQAKCQCLDVVVGRGRDGLKHPGSVGSVLPFHKHPVQEDRVKVRIKIKNSTEALNEGHGPGLAAGQPGLPGAHAQPGRHGALEGRQDPGQERLVCGQVIPHLPG